MPGKLLPKTSRCLLVCFCSLILPLADRVQAQTLNLPQRPPGALTGSQFIRLITPMSVTERENWIYAQVTSGNVPNFLRTLVPITVNGAGHTLTYYAAPDYLAIGSDADYFLEPMSPLLAQRICDAIGCTLPTRRMVNQISTNAIVRLSPYPFSPATYNILSVDVFSLSNDAVGSQRAAQTNAHPLGSLVDGDKKDVIISSKIYTNFAQPSITKVVVIFGWHYPDGSWIQNLYNGHEETYADYSHGGRLIQNSILLDSQPNTITNILTDPNLAGLISDEGASEGTSAGVINVPRYTVAHVAPAVINHPRSQTVTAGSEVTFRVSCVGDMPMSYRWVYNGATISGATNSILTVTNAQGSITGSYSVVLTNAFGAVTSRVALLKVNTDPLPVLFADEFELNTETNWSLYWGAANGMPDYTADWAFDYGGEYFTFNGVRNAIPPAPNSTEGNTRAVRLTVNNNDSTQSIAGLNIYPRGQFFSGNFALKFDLWINYPGNVGGTGTGIAGSTEHAIFGINHSASEANWAATSASSSDGIWFGMDGEGGTTHDYRSYVGNPSGIPTELTGASSGLIATDAVNVVFQTLFPGARFETAGSPGKNWVEAELRQTNNLISWFLDGTLVAQRVNASPFTSGNIMLGFMDVFPSIASPARDAFVLFDNVRVEDLSGKIRFLSAALLPNKTSEFVFSAVPGKQYIVQGSTNLFDWEEITNLTAVNGPLRFADPAAASFAKRFYRVSSAP